MVSTVGDGVVGDAVGVPVITVEILVGVGVGDDVRRFTVISPDRKGFWAGFCQIYDASLQLVAVTKKLPCVSQTKFYWNINLVDDDNIFCLN